MRATASATQIRRDVASLLLPPRRVPVSEAAEQSLHVLDGGGSARRWDPHLAPYIVEPMNCLASRQYDAVVFVGPARSAKTMGLIDGFLAWMLTCDPADTLVVQISEEKAREFSKKRLDREFRMSPDLAAKLSRFGHDNNVHDRIFAAGNYLGIKWPSKNVLASSDYRFVLLTDYDRMPEDIGGEGDGFTLGSKRTQTFGSTGMTLVEGSPSREILDPDWQQPEDEPHKAPPTTGILSIYNQGDRRRLYWPCDHCGAYYQPTMENWHGESARPVCPHCGGQPEPSQKTALNARSIWVPEGCTIEGGEVVGERRNTRVASFWMEGPAAALQTWRSLQSNLASAEAEYQESGSQQTVKTRVNVDWGRPYLHRRGVNQRSSQRLMDRADDSSPRAVPEAARFLTAAVDVQGGKDRRFVVQIHGWGPGREQWVVDRFNIKDDRDTDGNVLRQVDPATRPEDWDILTRDLLPRTYALGDGSGRRMPLMAITVDIGGEGGESAGEGVTAQAYDWWRRLRRQKLHHQVYLVKGSSWRTTTRIRKSYPDNTKNRNRRSGAKGDVPIYLLATDQLKDTVAAALDRPEPGFSYLHTPNWLGSWFYDELSYEERGSDGKWRRPGNRANEAFDLCAYNLAAWIILGADKIDWEAPPPWAGDWGVNPYLIASDGEQQTPSEQPTRRRRRRSRSSYIG